MLNKLNGNCRIKISQDSNSISSGRRIQADLMRTLKWIRSITVIASNTISIIAVAADLETAAGEEEMTDGIKDRPHMKKEAHQHIVIMMMLI